MGRKVVYIDTRTLPEQSRVTEETLRVTASIIGPHAAAHGALRDMEERRAKGQMPVCYQVGNSLIVLDAKEHNDGE
jgi:hypothetical protein